MNKVETKLIHLHKDLQKISFKDNYKQHCSMQISKVLLESKILLGVEMDIIGEPVNAFMHLTQEQAKELLPYLQKFAESGTLF